MKHQRGREWHRDKLLLLKNWDIDSFSKELL